MILVTGASGFIGRHAVAELLARGHAVRACTRDPSATLPTQAQRILTGDLESMDWSSALQGVNCIVHLAGRAHVDPGNDAELRRTFHRINADSTERLGRAAVTAGVSRFVFVSSIGVHGNYSRGRPFSEADQPAPREAYAVSKWEAERALGRVFERNPLELVVIRPTLVAGAKAPGNLARLAAFVRRRVPLPVGKISNRRSLVGVRSLASLLANVCVHPQAAGKCFVAADDPALSTAEIVAAIAQGMGVSPRLISVPPALLKWAGFMSMQSRQVQRLCESLEVNSDLARRVLGWAPVHTIQDELRELGRSARSG